MSKIGKKLIPLPAGVTLQVVDGVVSVKGPKGELSRTLPAGVTVTMEDQMVSVGVAEGTRDTAVWGLTRALVRNMIEGVATGFTRSLELNGVGYKAALKDKSIELNLGFSHPITFPLPEGITVTIEKNIITVSGVDRAVVGQTAAHLRSLKVPDPYKVHGVKYTDEVIKTKAGKKAAAAA